MSALPNQWPKCSQCGSEALCIHREPRTPALPDLIEIKGTDADGWSVRIRCGVTHHEFQCKTLEESTATVLRVVQGKLWKLEKVKDPLEASQGVCRWEHKTIGGRPYVQLVAEFPGTPGVIVHGFQK